MRSHVFMERTRAAYHLHHRRAKQHGQHLDYDMEAFRRQHVEEFLTRASCCYCNGRIDANNFSSDHMQPVSRGGTFSLDNIAVCCKSCNEAKGNMSLEEYQAFQSFLQ